MNDSFIQINKISKHFGNVKAVDDVSFQIKEGEFFSLLGPSGCGKTTLLRLLAGFEYPTSGNLLLDGSDITALPPDKRPTNMVFQNYAIFPHINVEKNVQFGLRKLGLTNDEIIKRVKDVLSLVKLEGYEERYSSQLSGGQRQRVAMGRAIVRNPKAFLFDEPLSNLDAKLRGQVRIEIKKLQKQMGVTSVFVTHDQVEAMTLGDRLAVINEGVIEQVGSPIEVYENPATYFVAEFIGTPQMNFVNGEIKSNQFVSKGFSCPLTSDISDQEVIFGIRPENLKVNPNGNITIKVDLIEKLGADSIIYGYDKSNNYICYRENGNTKIKSGEEITLEIEEGVYHLFDKETKKRLN